ncbi:MAG: hypothetical protein F4X82_00835 [Candidatus Spechtbacteria bacterium SB0662_bin_43]|uniref:DUF2269 family protein n=1 Tax=Candidatus Spechtbacteria bacterium SB0662_bin_43 TaxID=2604897 RepID=A0A845D8K1_9BACT|nr:hypothetical protein [Candidatus Spechtbacteria bacterium SB0662_bin_43]
MGTLPSLDFYTILVILHLIGMSFGVVGASVSDMLFFKAIKDGIIDKQEFGIFQFFGRLIWVGLSIAIVSGIGFLVWYIAQDITVAGSDVEKIENPKIWAKVTIVAIITLNGLVLHRKILPLLRDSVGKPLVKTGITRHLTLVLTSGAVSITSWWSAFIIGAWSGLNFSLSSWAILVLYAVIVCSTIGVANVIGRRHLLRSHRNNKT